MTITYPSPIFGPVKSRRLGISLGINLMPGDGKWCSFDCLYCECGLNKDKKAKQPLPSVEEVKEKLEAKLKEMSVRGEELNVLTFSGNGEPTMHPSFLEIVENVIILRNKYYPEAKVSVLSNSTQVHRKDVFEALMKVDNALMKLDTVSPEYIKLVDQPNVNYNIENIIDCLEKMKGHAIIQTMFMKGNIKDKNGKEIYEGDIIHAKGNTFDKDFGVVTYHKNGYFYIDDSFGEFPRSCVKPIGDFFNSISRNDFFQGMEFYVIGNIHDNKELLKDI